MKKSIYKIIASLAGALLAAVLFVLPASAAETDIGAAGERLDANTQKLYLAMREEITRIANGETTSAALSIDGETLAEWGLKLKWTREELGVDNITPDNLSPAFEYFWAQFEDVDQLMIALLHDCPYEMYWYDKTEGYYRTPLAMYSDLEVEFGGIEIRFIVARDYRPDGYTNTAPTLSPTKVAAANILDEVDAIVSKYADRSDYDKLVAYRDEIKALVSYDFGAASNSYTGGYGDPWQVISVFDGKGNTNVVCEGYAKAFQLLCERSDFTNDVKCYTVDGFVASGERHMWNIVDMGDGNYYLVDVTNSDTGMSGEQGGLFLDGYDSKITGGYRLLTVSGTQSIFRYSTETQALWENTGILELSQSDYEPPALDLTVPEAFVYDGTVITVGNTESSDIRYRLASSITGEFDWEILWYNGTDLMTTAPVNAGVYTLTVRATNKADPDEYYEQTVSVTVERAIPAYTVPRGLRATYGDLLSSVTLPTGFSFTTDPSAKVGNAGEHKIMLIYTPTDTVNYETVTGIEAKLTVKKAIPTYTVPTDLTASFGDLFSSVLLPSGFYLPEEADGIFHSLGTETISLFFSPLDRKNYEVVEDIEVEVKVMPRDISDATVTLERSPTYTGKELTQSIKRIFCGWVEVTDYTVSGNVATEVGTYTMTITGKGNFTGSKTVQWRITNPAQPQPDAEEDQDQDNSSTSDVGGADGPTKIVVGTEIPWLTVGLIGGGVLLVTLVIMIAVVVANKRDD